MSKYRRLFEPEKGVPAPEVMIDKPQEIDLDDIGVWRHKNNLETIAALTNLMKPCYCYEPLMQVRIENLQIESDDGLLPLRIYLPEGKGPHPIMIFIHGGGWTMNNLDVYDYVPRYFAKYGDILVITPDYRLAPENPFPAAFNDVYNTLVWTEANALNYGGDISNISLAGDSAGANLAAAACIASRDRGGPKIKSQILIYGAYDLRKGERTNSELLYGNGDYFLELNSEEGLCPWYVTQEEDLDNPYVSPLSSSELENLPAAYFYCGDCDPLLDQNLMYAAKLEDCGNEVEFSLIKGMIHAFINRPYQKTFELFDEVIAILKGD